MPALVQRDQQRCRELVGDGRAEPAGLNWLHGESVGFGLTRTSAHGIGLPAEDQFVMM